MKRLPPPINLAPLVTILVAAIWLITFNIILMILGSALGLMEGAGLIVLLVWATRRFHKDLRTAEFEVIEKRK